MTYDDITIPGISVPYKLTHLSRMDFEGLPAATYSTIQSPRQVGIRVTNVNFQARRGVLLLNIPKKEKAEVLHMLNQDRPLTLESTYTYTTYKEGGKIVRGNDGMVPGYSYIFTSNTGNFIDGGGLQKDNYITIDGSSFKIRDVLSDTQLELYCAILTKKNNIVWSYMSGITYRKLDFLVDGGLKFIRTTNRNTQTVEVLDIIAPYPFWYGRQQRVKLIPYGEKTYKTYPARYPDQNRFDSIKFLKTLDVNLSCDVFIKPTIVLSGLMKYFIIKNLSDGTSLSYINGIPRNDKVTLDLNNMTVTNKDNQNMLKHVEGDRVSFGFNPYKLNQLEVTTDNPRGVSITWIQKFLGSNYER